MDFSIIIASSVHDLKNSVTMLLDSLDNMLDRQQGKDPALEKDISHLRYEALRVNSNLIQLLALYKIDNDQYALSMEHQLVRDFVVENLMQSQHLFEANNIDVELECDEELEWQFDANLISGVINDVVNNAIRYTKSKLKVSALVQGDYLCIRVDDDGGGYPESMLISALDSKRGISFSSGSTGLGLYFASMAAQVHRHKDLTGYISLSNESEYGGGRFQLFLPKTF